MRPMKEYTRRQPTRLTSKQTTVNIHIRHKEFIDENGLNLSRMVRDMIDSVMAKVKGSKV